MKQRDRVSVVDDQQLPARSLASYADAELGRAEVVAVLERLKDALKRPCAQALGAAFGPAAARLEERRLALDELGEPFDGSGCELDRYALLKVMELRPVMDERSAAARPRSASVRLFSGTTVIIFRIDGH